MRELGEQIGEQPIIEDANVDQSVIERAEQRGHELWAQDLLADLGVETVQGTLHLDELIEDLTLDAARTLSETVDTRGDELAKSDWKNAMTILRTESALTPTTLQRVWWLFPLYRERPDELADLLEGIVEKKAELEESETRSDSNESSVRQSETRSDGITPDGGTTIENQKSTSDGESTEKAGASHAAQDETDSDNATGTNFEDSADSDGNESEDSTPRAEANTPSADGDTSKGFVGRIRSLIGI